MSASGHRPPRSDRGRGRRSGGATDGRAQHISGIMGAALRDLGVSHEVEEVQLRAAFTGAVGPALAPLCQAISVQRGVLLVATRSGALAQQLQLEMPVIVAALNARLGADRVRRLRFTALA